MQPGHEYTKANVAFALSVTQNEATRKLGAFMQAHQESQGQFTIGDEKVSLMLFCIRYRRCLRSLLTVVGRRNTMCL